MEPVGGGGDFGDRDDAVDVDPKLIVSLLVKVGCSCS
jgi:hypothetical protein